jgi:excisionase family DNA binding protein
MTTNIRIKRICDFCSNEFEAKTTVTRYCSHKCNQRAYKANLRAGKISSSIEETKREKLAPIEEINAKEFLTVAETAKLLNSSKQIIYTFLKEGKIRGVNLKVKKTLIKRSDIDKLFEK